MTRRGFSALIATGVAIGTFAAFGAEDLSPDRGYALLAGLMSEQTRERKEAAEALQRTDVALLKWNPIDRKLAVFSGRMETPYVTMNGQHFPWNAVRKNTATGCFEAVDAI